MCQPGKWWVGLVPLALLFAIAMGLTPTPVERDLVGRTAEELKRSGLPWARAALSGRDAVVEGVAPDPESQKLARDAAQRAFGVRQVADRTTVLPEAKPYVVAAARSGNKITLTGSVPSDEARAAAVTAAKAAIPNAEVVDERTLARGAPAGYAAGLGHGLAQVGRLASGSASLTDSALTVTGRAADFPGFDAVTAALKALPQGIGLAKADIAPPVVAPYVLGAAKGANGITLTGYIPAESARAGIVAAARAAAGGGAVTDNLRVADGAPQGLDFAGASTFALGQLARLGTGVAGLSGNGLSVVGKAMDFAGFDAVGAALKSLPAGVALSRAEIAPPTVSPFDWNAAKTASGVALSGVIPSEALRSSIVAAARAAAGGGSVSDGLRVADGAPAGLDYGQATGFALGQLARLKSGTAKISGNALSVTGDAPDVPTYEAVRGALAAASLPGGIRLAAQAITGPTAAPFTWGARRDGNSLTLDGFVPSEAARTDIVLAARSQFAGVSIVDQMKLALGAPNGFVDAARAGLAQLAKLASGAVAISNTALTVSGEALQNAVATQVRSALGSGLPAGFSAQANLTVRPPPPPPPPPPAPPAPVVAAAPNLIVPTLPPVILSPVAQECQDKFKDMLAKEKILFATGRADIQEESNALIRALAEQAQKCSAARIEVQGHTDSDGAADANKALSDRRAAAVVQRLQDFGIERSRLRALGLGQTQPVADNATPEGKARNRRIEFVVTE